VNTLSVGDIFIQLKNPQSRPLDGESASRNALRLQTSSGKYDYGREKTLRFELKPGIYVIIPTTFYPNEEAEFMLRIYTEKAVQDSGYVKSIYNISLKDFKIALYLKICLLLPLL